MSKELVNAPTARTWREIPQPVKPRAMSRGGRWRLARAILRATTALAVVAGLAWTAWTVAKALQGNARIAGPARVPAMKPPELVTDGTLDNAWLARTLQLPKGATLQGLDLLKLRARLLEDGQVLTANVMVHLPDRLEARITERTPIARVMVEAAGEQRVFVVARDGVVFDGLGYGDAIIQTLPWLDGVTITRTGATFRPIAGMDVVSELLAKARLEAEHLYRTWHVVSLARLQSDREIDVRTRAPHEVTITFGANEDFFRQLARLDYTWEKLTSAAAVRARVDLSLGRDVLVTVEQASSPDGTKPSAAKSAAAPEFSIFRSTVSQTKREL